MAEAMDIRPEEVDKVDNGDDATDGDPDSDDGASFDDADLDDGA